MFVVIKKQETLNPLTPTVAIGYSYKASRARPGCRHL